MKKTALKKTVSKKAASKKAASKKTEYKCSDKQLVAMLFRTDETRKNVIREMKRRHPEDFPDVIESALRSRFGKSLHYKTLKQYFKSLAE